MRRSTPALIRSSLILVLVLSACGTVLPTPAPVTLRIAAASGVAPLAEDLAVAFQSGRPEVTVTLETLTGSLAAVERVRTGQADLAITSRLPDPSPLETLQATQVAWDALAVIVPAGNPLPDLTTRQVQRIFAGLLQEWSDLDAGADLIQVVSRENGSGSRAAFEAAMMSEYAVTPAALLIPNSQAVVDFVARNQASIGYAPIPTLHEGVRAITIDGLPADADVGPLINYPLLLPVYLVTNEQPASGVEELLEFTLSRAGQQAVDQRYGRVR